MSDPASNAQPPRLALTAAERGSDRALAFCLLTFFLTWPVAIAALSFAQHWSSLKIPGGLQMLAALAPGFAAAALSAHGAGERGLGALFGRAIRWRLPPRLYAAALALSLGSCLFVFLLVRAFMAPDAALRSPVDLLMYFLLILPLSALWEEIGWRGFLLPALLKRMGRLPAAILVGVIWGVWHLPIVLGAHASLQDGLAQFGAMFTGCIAMSLVLTWLYETSGGSLVLCILFHNGVNAGAYYFFASLPGSSLVPLWGLSIAFSIASVPVVGNLLKRDHTGTSAPA